MAVMYKRRKEMNHMKKGTWESEQGRRKLGKRVGQTLRTFEGPVHASVL